MTITMREKFRKIPDADLPPATGTRATTMDEFLLDLEHVTVPGTGAGPEPHPNDPDYQLKLDAWNAAGGFGRIRRGLMTEDMDAFGPGAEHADHPAPGFTLIDRDGHAVMRGEYASSRMGPAVFRALRDLLDAIDPLPEYTEADYRRSEELAKAEIRQERREARLRRKAKHTASRSRRRRTKA